MKIPRGGRDCNFEPGSYYVRYTLNAFTGMARLRNGLTVGLGFDDYRGAKLLRGGDAP